MFSRRDFFKQGLLPVFAGSAVPSVCANGVAAAAADSPSATPSDRVLVLVQLAGGNDGLNTVIPFGDGAYHDARPTLRQDQGVLALNGQLGLHPNLKGLKASWDAGQLAIVQGVGYPSPNLSHFASMSIWETASVQGGIGDGWLGRYLNYLDQVGETPNHALEGVSAGSLVPPELRSKTPVTALQSLRTFRLQPVNEHGTQVDVENPLMKFYGAFKGAGPAPFGALFDTTLLGAPVKGGLYGQQPSLTDLDNGNLKFGTDFRSVYASVLQGYLKAPASDLLGGNYEILPLLKA